MRDHLKEIMDNADRLKNNPTDFASLKIDGKSYFLTTIEQLKCFKKDSPSTVSQALPKSEGKE